MQSARQTAAEDLGQGALALCCSKRNSNTGFLKLHPGSRDGAFLLECVPGISSLPLYFSETAFDFESNKVMISHINAETVPFSFKLILITSGSEKTCQFKSRIAFLLSLCRFF